MRLLHRYHNDRGGEPGSTRQSTLLAAQAAALLLMLLMLLLSAPGHAHLMPAQRGTLNFVNDKVFVVLSLPVSAFEGIDDNRDGAVTGDEFRRHSGIIAEAVRTGVTLRASGTASPLLDVMLSPEAPHGGSADTVAQITVMGRFDRPQATTAELRFRVALYGEQPPEQRLQITARERGSGWSQRLELTPAVPVAVLDQQLSN